MTLDEQIAALVEAASRLGLGPEELSDQIGNAWDDLSPGAANDFSPEDFGFIQTPLSKQLLPGDWMWTNLQFRAGSIYRRAMDDVDEVRIQLNVGCDVGGNLRPAAFRGFEQSGSVHSDARLSRHNSTDFLFDVKAAKFGYVLDTSKPIGRMFDDSKLRFSAVRCADDAALDEWVRWAHQERQKVSPQ